MIKCPWCNTATQYGDMHECGGKVPVPKEPTIEETLKERGDRYGSLWDNGLVAQGLKDFLHSQAKWGLLGYDQQEALDQICSKIARVFSGDPKYKDNWHDIAGYATCVEKAL